MNFPQKLNTQLSSTYHIMPPSAATSVLFQQLIE